MSVTFTSIQQALKWLEENSEPNVKESWLLGSFIPVTTILVVYLVFVRKIGPEFMKYREPLNIYHVVMIYNVVQVLFSAYLVIASFILVWLRDDYRLFCVEFNKEPDLVKRQFNGIRMFMLCKCLDLFDTVFFVLRKKQNQVTFLHVYHHTMIVIVCFLVIYFRAGGQGVFFCTVNSFVHFIMYIYYLLAIVDPKYKKAWWKKYLTIMQLVQFVIIGIHLTISLLKPDCSFPRVLMVLIMPQVIFMFILFHDFYQKAYVNKKKK